MEIVRRGIEAWNRRDPITLSALWRSDGVLDWSRARGPFKGVYRGDDERAAFFNEFWSTFQYVQLETYDVAEAGSEVVISNTAHMWGRDGIEVSARSTLVFTVENGQITTTAVALNGSNTVQSDDLGPGAQVKAADVADNAVDGADVKDEPAQHGPGRASAQRPVGR